MSRTQRARQHGPATNPRHGGQRPRAHTPGKMNTNRTRARSVFHHWKAWVVVAVAMVNGLVASAQETNDTGRVGFSAFQVISRKNIFNLNRTGRRRDRGRSQRGGDAFSLVGTMSYGKGTFAFFDGTASEYKKVLQDSDAIAGYKVVEITPTSVKLETGGKQVTMKVGTQMRHETEGGWQLVANSELSQPSVEETAATLSDTTSSSSSDEPNDVLRRLMQRREQELK